jgi:hypothetical protein
MGYYSYYKLEVSGNSGEYTEKIIEQLRDWSEDAEYALDEEGQCMQEEKWYEADNELKEFSKHYPDRLFTLWADGEESDDQSVTYFKNGKMQKEVAKITFNPFDESKLK